MSRRRAAASCWWAIGGESWRIMGDNICLAVLLLIVPASSLMNHTDTWTSKNYPDLRVATRKPCGTHMPLRPYLCDPDGLITREDAESLNIQLHELTNATGCKCQRIGQCIGEDLEGNHVEVGFIVAVAFARQLQINDEEPNMEKKLEVAEKFCVGLRGKWALGDCGNTAIILIWQTYDLLYILPDRLTKLYVTPAEVELTKKKVQHLIKDKQYRQALDIVLKDIEKEIKGTEETPTDVGQLSLIISVAVAVVFVCIITACVCAFRCCGNLRQDNDNALGQTVDPVDSLKAQVIRRGSQIRRSLSRSPKLPHHQASHRLDHAVPLIQSQSVHSRTGMPSPSSAASRQLLASIAAQQLPKRTNMARLASPYYGVEDGHSMV